MKKCNSIALIITLFTYSCSNPNYDYSISIKDSNIIISTTNPNESTITIEREFGPVARVSSKIVDGETEWTVTSLNDSTTLHFTNKEIINTSNILMNSQDKMYAAYEYAKFDRIAWRVYNKDIDTVVYTNPFNKRSSVVHYAFMKSGAAAKLTNNSNNNITNIKSYLYDLEIQFTDSLINKMRNTLNQLNNSEYIEFVTTDEIPIVKSLNNLEYNISTNIEADYYYLVATNSEDELKGFIKEVSLNDFKLGESNINNALQCINIHENGGYLSLMLIGLNKDWTKYIYPVGIVAVDNIKPSVMSDNNTTLLASEMYNLVPEDLTLSLNKVKIIMPDKYPEISGKIFILTNEFRGNTANFELQLFDDGDVESISIKREVHRDYMKWVMKPETKTIKLSDKKSPYHFTYELDLGIGDNYIPITVTDKRGNKTNYTYKISMEQVEDDNPDINIDNNIDIYQ